jgi:hypothetical protein
MQKEPGVNRKYSNKFGKIPKLNRSFRGCNCLHLRGITWLAIAVGLVPRGGTCPLYKQAVQNEVM